MNTDSDIWYESSGDLLDTSSDVEPLHTGKDYKIIDIKRGYFKHNKPVNKAKITTKCVKTPRQEAKQ